MDEDKDTQNPGEANETPEGESSSEELPEVESSTEEPDQVEESADDAEAGTDDEDAAPEVEASKDEEPAVDEITSTADESSPKDVSGDAGDSNEKPSSKKVNKESTEESGEEKKPEKKQEETAEDLLKSELADVKIRRAKGSKNITHGIVHVTASFNNTKINITDMKGNTIAWSSSGKCNFRGSRKSTAYAAQVVTTDAGRTAMSHGLKEVVVKVRGPGMGRDSAVRALQSLGLTITSIVDVTPVPHNGCRPPKRRRV